VQLQAFHTGARCAAELPPSREPSAFDSGGGDDDSDDDLPVAAVAIDYATAEARARSSGRARV